MNRMSRLSEIVSPSLNFKLRIWTSHAVEGIRLTGRASGRYQSTARRKQGSGNDRPNASHALKSCEKPSDIGRRRLKTDRSTIGPYKSGTGTNHLTLTFYLKCSRLHCPRVIVTSLSICLLLPETIRQKKLKY